MSKYRRGYKLPRKGKSKFGLQFLANIPSLKQKKTINDRIPKSLISVTTMKTLVNATALVNAIPITANQPISPLGLRSRRNLFQSMWFYDLTTHTSKHAPQTSLYPCV